MEDKIKLLETLSRAMFRDVSGLPFMIKNETESFVVKNNCYTLNDKFAKYLKKHPEKPCIIFNEKVWTYHHIECYSNKIANYFLREGYKKGDCVALFLTNSPEYAATWLGLSKIGVISALINTNLKTKSLVHCISVAKAKAVIYDIELKSGKT
jgi:solute carrier family 27 (fatty acid transporter), member 1/4